MKTAFLEATLRGTRTSLQDAGFRVIEASHASLFAAMVQRPDVVVLDGAAAEDFALTRHLRGQLPGTVIIHVGGDLRAGLTAGGDSYAADASHVVALAESLLRLAGTAAEENARAARLVEADHRKNEFLAKLAHELRNPLSAVQLGVSLLATDAEPKVIASMQRQMTHLARMVDDLLDVSRIIHGKMDLRRSVVDLRDIINAAVEAARPAFDAAGLVLRLHVPMRVIPVDGDPMRLEQVVANLLANALKYTPRLGTVTVTAECGQGQAWLNVRDTGIGISRERLANLFDLFYQVDMPRGGLGIGLAVVRRLVELHDGTVTAQSDGDGKGSHFTVKLPLSSQTPQALSTPALSLSTGARRVLLVDDNVDSCTLFEMALADRGHTVHTAYNGAMGLNQLLENAYDVAVIDIGLPDMNGHDLVRRAREYLGPKAPRFVALTGYGRDDDRRASLKAGFHTHLVKPVQIDVLMEALVSA